MNSSFRAPSDAVIVVGAGLSGLLSAFLLEQQGQSVLLIESRERIGGRVLSDAAHSGVPFVDLGPGWVWPSMNERLSYWNASLGLTLFAQHTAGAAVIETQHHEVRRNPSTYVQMPMSQRWTGGAAALPQALAARLKRTQITLGTRVTRIRHASKSFVVMAHSAAGGEQAWHGSSVILTLPPRLLAEHVSWEPALPADLSVQWERTPTWMAGHAKFVAAYAKPFWREAGLSGHAASHAGPMVEIHDASNASGELAALFGFIGIPASWRTRLGKTELIQRCLQQLAGLFGPQAAQPLWVKIKDWAQDPHTATAADSQPLNVHPTQPPRDLPAPWRGGVFLAGSEFADDFNGYLEGAARSAEMALAEWKKETTC